MKIFDNTSITFGALPMGAVFVSGGVVAIKVNESQAVDLETGTLCAAPPENTIVAYYPKATLLLNGKE